MDYGALISESIDYTREALVGNWITPLIIILCYLPFTLVRFVCDPKKILADGTIHWELIPWPELLALTIAGFLLLIVLYGFTTRLYRGTAPPVFDAWGSLYLDGIKLLIVNILWFIPFVILSIVLLVFLFPLVFLIGPDSIALWVVCMVAVLLVAFMPLIIAFLYSTLGSVHYARTGSIREGIRFSAINRMIRAMGWGTYILAMVILLVAAVFFGIVQSVLAQIPVGGWVIQLVLSPVILVFTARYISRVYDHGIPQEPAGDPAGEGRQQMDAAL